MTSKTLYGVLGVHRQATQNEIKAAYRALASEHHPDRGGDHAKMAELTVAYNTLGDADNRASYDETLSLIGTPCGSCGGEGVKWKQKGFSARVATPCKTCDGEGYSHVKPISVNVMNLGGSPKRRKK